MSGADLPAVCALYEQVVRSGQTHPASGMLDYFERSYFGHPWADESIPSLVYETTDGEIVGFLGSHVRRLRIDGRSVRLACSGQLVASSSTRHRGVGALLTRRYFQGPQDITITDGATDAVRQMWAGFGGRPLAHASLSWTRVFRPGATATALARQGGRSRTARALGLFGPALDASSMLLAGPQRLLPAEPEASAEDLTAEGLVAEIQRCARWLRLYPDYDTAYVRWLFAELDAVHVRGRSVRHLVRDSSEQVIGWYVYYLKKRDLAQVLQVAAPGRNAERVLEHLFWHAAQGGAVAVQGRLEPHLVGLLDGRRCVLRRSQWALIHCDNQAVMGLIGSPRSLLTRMEGEWWMGHHVLWRNEVPQVAASVAAGES